MSDVQITASKSETAPKSVNSNEGSKQPKVLKPVVKTERSSALLPLGGDETARNSFKVTQPKVAVLEYTFTPNEDKLRYQTTTVLDFSQCSDDEILELASKSIVIRLQNARRQLPLSEALSPHLHAKVDVKDELSQGRKQADPATQARSAIRRLEPSEARKLLEELQKNLK